MTTPNTANPAVTQKLNVQALADAAQTSRTPYVAKAADLKGFDAEALIQFQNTLPSFKRAAAKVGEEKEEFIDANGNVIDEPQWQVAQASGGTTTDAASGSAGGAGDGGAAGGSGGGAADGAAGGAGDGGAAGGAGGGGGAGAAGAGPATMGLAPVAMIPLALVPKNPHDNHAPTLGVVCNDPDRLPNDPDAYMPAQLPTFASPELIQDEGRVHLRLAINAPAGQAASGPVFSAQDQDGDQLGFFFSDGLGHRSSYADVNGHIITDPNLVASEAYYQIDADGCVSLTTLGASHTDLVHWNANQYALGHVDLQVVAYDGALESNVLNVTLDRALDDANTYTHAPLVIKYIQDNVDPTFVDHNAYDVQGGLHNHDDPNTVYVTGHVSGMIDAPVNDLDVLDLGSVEGAVNFTAMDFHREAGDLHISLSVGEGCGNNYEIQVCNQYGFGPADALNYVHSIEFAHFAAGSTYEGYELNTQVTDSICNSGPSWMDLGGNYLISLENTGTDYNDLIAGSDACGDTLSGGLGNDLLFAHGEYATLEGGTGDDLLVASGNGSYLCGDEGNDTLVTNGCEATLVGGAGDDRLVLNGHENTVVFNTAYHVVDGNAVYDNGTDSVIGFFANCESNNQINLVDELGNSVACNNYVESTDFISFMETATLQDFLGSVIEVDLASLFNDPNALDAYSKFTAFASQITNSDPATYFLVADGLGTTQLLELNNSDPQTYSNIAVFEATNLIDFSAQNFHANFVL